MSADGDVELGIAITVRSALLLFQLSRVDECLRFASAATDALEGGATVPAELKFELHIVHGFILYHTRGYVPATHRSFEYARALAQECGDSRQLALAVGASWMGAYIRGESRAMLALAQQFEALTAGDTDPATILQLDRMKAPALHRLGDLRGARRCAERSLAVPLAVKPSFLSASQVDRSAAMGAILARVLWLQGLPDQAEEVAARTIERAYRDGESVSLAFALAFAVCPLAFWTGRLDVARERVSRLLRHTTEHSLVLWRNYAIAFDALLAWHENGQGGDPLRAHGIGIDQYPMQLAELLATLHPALADENTFVRGDTGDAGWCQAELLRVRGERASGRDRKAAEALFLRSLERARQDGALSWELRTSTSLGRLWMEQGRKHEALELVQSVVNQVTEGHLTPDVREAVALHDMLAGSITPPPHRRQALYQQRYGNPPETTSGSSRIST